MVQVDPIDRLMRAALVSDEEFVTTLNDLLKLDLRISVRELSEKSGIAQSSLYKIIHGNDPPTSPHSGRSSAPCASNIMWVMRRL